MNNQADGSEQSTKKLGSFDYIKITLLGFALTALWSSLHSVILPIRLLEYVPVSEKNTLLGILTFTGLILAMIIQPIAGAFSDHTVYNHGRRHPYILVGIVLALIFIPGIGLASSYVGIFIIYCMLQISCNTAQASYNAFIPDLIPQNKRGLSSGVKSFMETLGGVLLVLLTAYLMGHYQGGEKSFWLWTALGVLITILFIAMIITLMTVKDKPITEMFKSSPLPLTLYKIFRIDFKVHRDFGWFLVSRVFLVIPATILQIFALYYLMDVVGIANPAAVAGDLLVVIGVCLLVTAYPAGRLSDRVGRKPILIFSGLLGAMGILSLLFSRNFTEILFSGAVIGIANGALASSSWALATDLAPKGEEARYLGVTNIATAGGSALARLLGGPVIDSFNKIGPKLGYQVMLLFCLISLVIGVLLVIKIKYHETLR